MNMFYGFTYEFSDGKLSDSIVTDEDTIKAIPEDRHSVGVIPIVVKCVECGEYMTLINKKQGNPYIGTFVCPTCKRSIGQYDIFMKMEEEANRESFMGDQIDKESKDVDKQSYDIRKLNALYSLSFDGEELSNFNIDSTAIMNAIMPKYTVGDGATVVKCVHCNTYMLPKKDHEDRNFVCENCGRKISARRVLKEIEKNVEMAINGWEALIECANKKQTV